MAQQSFDPGLTQQYGGKLRRSVNEDGSFNVRRVGTGFRHWNLYLYLVRISWWKFLGLVFGAYFVTNCLFATLYYMIGIRQLQGADLSTPARGFFSAFFFSTQTLTTVGYGSVSPGSILTNTVAALEALLGLLGFAVATGLLVGRVSRPSARLAFSETALISPYQGGTSLQFRIANRRSNPLMELEAQVLLMTVDETSNGLKRDFVLLGLERPSVMFIPLTWTVVHPIDAASPLHGRTPEDLQRLQAEVIIMIKAFDETFSQTVHARYSYTYAEILWHPGFAPAFDFDSNGDMVLHVDQVSKLKNHQP